MPLRNVPPARIVYERIPQTDYFELHKSTARAELSALRAKEARGEIEELQITWPPQVDTRGIRTVTAMYWERRLMTDDEIDRKEKEQLEQYNRALKAGGPALQSGNPGPIPGMTLTQEEKDMLTPYRGPQE